MMRCDHCRRELGRHIHRYWRMRFCSSACVDDYRHQLDHETILKIRELDFAEVHDPQKPGGPAIMPRIKPWLGGFVWSLPR
jgi:hypothetical protein